MLVLRNNLQTLALSLAERKGVAETGFLTRLMQSLEQRGLLDRAVEFLPNDVGDRRAPPGAASPLRGRNSPCCWLMPS